MVLVYLVNNGLVRCNICWLILEDDMSNIVLIFGKYIGFNVRLLSKKVLG